MTALAQVAAVGARRAYDATVVTMIAAACLYGLATAVLRPAAAQAVAVVGGPVLAAAAGVALVGITLVAASRLGPLWVTAPEHRWRPADALLRERSRTVLRGAVSVAVLVGLVTAAAVPGWRVACGVGAAAAVLVAVTAAALGQRLDRAATAGSVGAVLVVAGIVVTLLGATAGAAPLLVVIAGATAAGLLRTRSAGSTRTPLHGRPVPPSWELRRAGATVDALRTATVLLDGTPLSAAADARLAPRRRPVAVPDVLRPLVRALSTSRVVDLVPLLAVPAAVAAVGGTAAAVVAVLVVTHVVTVVATRWVDVWFDSPALARTFATRRPPLVAVLAGTAAVLVGGAAVVSCALAGIGPGWGAVAVGAAVLTWERRLSGRRLAGRVGALVATPMGAVPVDLAQRVVAGPDVLLVSVLVLPALGVGAALVVVLVGATVYGVAVTARGR